MYYLMDSSALANRYSSSCVTIHPVIVLHCTRRKNIEYPSIDGRVLVERGPFGRVSGALVFPGFGDGVYLGFGFSRFSFQILNKDAGFCEFPCEYVGLSFAIDRFLAYF